MNPPPHDSQPEPGTGKRVWWLGRRGEGYVVVQVLLFALVVFGPRRLQGWAIWSQGALSLGQVFGSVLFLLGAGLAITGLIALGRNISPFPHPLENASLVIKGPYRIVRHPIYSGIFLAALGWGCLVAGTLTLVYAAILLLFFDIKTRREERWLRVKFEAFSRYHTEVRKLNPFIY